jgi:two-component system LytT family response regulator
LETIRALVVDDEQPARARLRDLLAAHEDVAILGEAGGGKNAVALIGKEKADVVFLDVQMPDLDGFGVIAEVGAEHMPITVFVTAYDEYALRAFDVHAIDYLLKPFSDERFESALEEVRNKVALQQSADVTARLNGLIADYRSAGEARPRHLDRLVVRRGGRMYLVSVDDIDWIQGAGVYVRLHTDDRTHLYRSSLTALEEALDPRQFQRVHRSAIVRISAIREIRPESHGDCWIILKDDTEIRLSRSYRTSLRERLGQKV